MTLQWGRVRHDQLAHDLAEFRRGCGEIVAEKVGLGQWGGSAQLDVAAMKPSWTNPNPTAYEVKVSRSDFLKDTQQGKYRKYLPYVRRLYFAAPSGLLSKEEIPAGMGLIVRGDNGWHVVKAPKVQQPDPTTWPTFLQALLMKDHPGPWARTSTRAERIAEAERTAEGSLRFRGLVLSRRVEATIARAERALEEVKHQRAHIAHLLGEDPGDRTLFQLCQELLNRRPYQTAPGLQHIRSMIEGAARTLERAADQLERVEEGMQKAGVS